MTADEIARLRGAVERMEFVQRRAKEARPDHIATVVLNEDTAAMLVRDVPRLLDERDDLIEYVEANERSQKAWRSDVEDVRAFLDARDRLRARGLIGGES